MKKIIFGLFVSYNLVFAYCFTNNNSQPTCSVVLPIVQSSIQTLIQNFNQDRRELVETPTKELNEKIKEYNKINGEIYKEQKAILVLNNEIVRATQEQEELLKKLSELKSVSVKYQSILQRTDLSESNSTR